jgi:hypothetical protein
MNIELLKKIAGCADDATAQTLHREFSASVPLDVLNALRRANNLAPVKERAKGYYCLTCGGRYYSSVETWCAASGTAEECTCTRPSPGSLSSWIGRQYAPVHIARMAQVQSFGATYMHDGNNPMRAMTADLQRVFDRAWDLGDSIEGAAALYHLAAKAVALASYIEDAKARS